MRSYLIITDIGQERGSKEFIFLNVILIMQNWPIALRDITFLIDCQLLAIEHKLLSDSEREFNGERGEEKQCVQVKLQSCVIRCGAVVYVWLVKVK